MTRAKGRWWREAARRKRADRRADAAWDAYRERFGRAPDCTIVWLDGRREEAASVVIAKGRHYAGRHIIAPAASLVEPSFQVVLFRGGGRVAVMRYGIALLRDRIPRLSDVSIIEGRDVVVVGHAAEAAQGDGDIVASLPLRVTLAGTDLSNARPTEDSVQAVSPSRRSMKVLKSLTLVCTCALNRPSASPAFSMASSGS